MIPTLSNNRWAIVDIWSSYRKHRKSKIVSYRERSNSKLYQPPQTWSRLGRSFSRPKTFLIVLNDFSTKLVTSTRYLALMLVYSNCSLPHKVHASTCRTYETTVFQEQDLQVLATDFLGVWQIIHFVMKHMWMTWIIL